MGMARWDTGVHLFNRLGHHLLIDMHVLHSNRNLGVSKQFLQHLHCAPVPDKLSGEYLAADVMMQVRFDAQLLADGHAYPIVILVGVVGKLASALLMRVL
jgi:hypothetical protein